MAKKVNTEAVVSAMIRQSTLYCDATSNQYKSIIYINPKTYQFDVKALVGISLRLTGRWDDVNVTGPECGDRYQHLRLIVAVDDLLPEFIVEGEEIPEDED